MDGALFECLNPSLNPREGGEKEGVRVRKGEKQLERG
jgi:hypothetical protein